MLPDASGVTCCAMLGSALWVRPWTRASGQPSRDDASSASPRPRPGQPDAGRPCSGRLRAGRPAGDPDADGTEPDDDADLDDAEPEGRVQPAASAERAGSWPGSSDAGRLSP